VFRPEARPVICIVLPAPSWDSRYPVWLVPEVEDETELVDMAY
jgi:hypothetical protein